MFSHIVVGTNDLEKAQVFYDALFAAIGGPEAMVLPNGKLAYMHKGASLMLTTPVNGEPATVSNGATIGFSMDSPEQAAAWHAAGIANGGTTCEDPPGIRDRGFSKMYLAYLRDPDGNKLGGMYRYVD